MDINLTGEIAANLVENLNSHRYDPFIFAGIAMISSIVTGIITLFGINITNKNAEKRELRKSQEERSNRRREELKTFYNDVTLKKLELYTQIRGLKPKLHHNFNNALIDLIEKLRYLAYLEIDDQKEPKDVGDLLGLEKLLEINKKHDENELRHEIELLEIYTTLSEKLGLSIIMFGKDNNKLKNLISSFEFIMDTESNISTMKISELYDNKEKNTYEEVDRIIEKLIVEVPSKSTQKIILALDKILLYMEDELRNETTWWQIDQSEKEMAQRDPLK